MTKEKLIQEIKDDGCALPINKLNDLTVESLEFIVTLRNWTRERGYAV